MARQSHVLNELRVIAGSAWSDDAAVLAPHLVDWRGRIRGNAALIVWPGDTAQVAALVKAASAGGVAIVPQGGNTGLVGGATPGSGGTSLIISMARMAAIGRPDPASLTMIVESGAILETVQQAAIKAGLTFPLSLAAKGSATIGGLTATNAGGVQVLRHGNMRRLVAGLEAVLPSGAVLQQLGPLAKDNSGYDIKQLLIGSEGTLGIITRVALRLVTAPRETVVAWVGAGSPQAALVLLTRLRDRLGDLVESFELVSEAGINLLVAQGLRAPLTSRPPWQVLVELASVQADAGLAAALADELAAVGHADAVVAQSQAQAAALWHLREMLPEAERREGVAIKHDISVAVAAMPDFITASSAAIEASWPGCRVLAFGHLGDGNIHFNVRPPLGADSGLWVERHGVEITRAVHDRVVAAGGSIAAEHGIGSVKRDELARVGDPAKLVAMRAIKAGLDPLNIMNPGKIIG